MASSQIKAENPPGPGGAFPFNWGGPLMPGGDTVVTKLRSDAQIVVPEPPEFEGASLVNRRLFPSNLDLDESAGIRIAHFLIQRRIGIGGMGSVFLATDEQLRRNVALKVLSPSMSADPAAVLRFQNEARAAARLDHDNIARIFCYGEEGGLHYIAYEFIPGSNLRDVIRSKYRLSPAEAVNYAMQLAAALSHTSAAGVIHRDIKPSNILITPQGRAKLVDLGLARKEAADSMSAELTVAGTTLGTFDYISPEQAKDPRSVDVRSDIYSLGCTLYHMLTGEPPYPEGTVLQKLLDHQGKEPPDPSRKNRRVPPALSAIVRKMMASDPRKRYSSPAKLLSDLLKVARLLGAGAVPIDGQVWLTATRFEQPAWQSNIGWIATAAALLFLVIAMERFPQLSRWVPRAATISSSANTGPQKQETSSVLPNRTESTPVAPQVNPHRPSNVVLPPSPADQGSQPRNDTGGKKVFDDIELISRMPGDAEPIPATTIDKNRVVPSSDTPSSTEPMPEKTPSRPANTAATTPESRPVISIVGGKQYSSLEAACSEAKDGTIIELRYNGRRGQSESPIRLTNKENVVIRSAIGFRPMIEFAPSDASSTESRMITVTGGSLQLVNVDVMMTVPNRITADRWAVFSLERPRELQLQEVTVTVVNPSGQTACAIEHKAAPGQVAGNMGIMKNGAPADAPQVALFDCLVRGQCDLFLLKDAVSVKFQVKDAVIALQGLLLHTACQSEMSNSETDRVVLDIDSSTCLAFDGIILTEGGSQLNDHTPPLTVNSRDSVFSCAPAKPLVAMLDAADLMEMQRRFVWNGDRNLYDSMSVFWQLGGRLGLAPTRQFDFNEWRSYWGSGEGPGSVNAPVKWQIRSNERIGPRIGYSDVELDASSATNAGGRLPGAILSKLPPVPGDRAALDEEESKDSE